MKTGRKPDHANPFVDTKMLAMTCRNLALKVGELEGAIADVERRMLILQRCAFLPWPGEAKPAAPERPPGMDIQPKRSAQPTPAAAIVPASMSNDAAARRIERRTYSVREAAKILGISANSAYEFVARGELKSVRIGRRIIIAQTEIDRLLGANAGDAQ